MAARSHSATAAIGAAVALLLTGCSMTAQVTTGKAYSASDGTSADVGGVVAQNLLLITPAAGEQAALVGSLYNSTNAPLKVVVTVEQEDVTFTIPAMSTVALGVAEGDKELVTTSSVAPGLTSEVTISVGTASSTKALPVLDGTLPEYQAILDELADADK